MIRYSQKVPILVREAIAHTTREFVRDRQNVPPRRRFHPPWHRRPMPKMEGVNGGERDGALGHAK